MRTSSPSSPRDPLLRPRRAFFFEKWYFDALADDGRFLFGYFAPVTVLGRSSAELVLCLCRPGEAAVERSFHLGPRAFALETDRQAARFDGGGLDLRGDRCQVAIRRGDVQLELDYARCDAPWLPGGDGHLWQQGRRALTWSVPLPRARATVRGHLGPLDVTLDGFGYADLVQTDIVPWRVPLRTLLWGRALSPDTTLIWERLSFAQRGPEQILGMFYLRLGDTAARELPITACALDGWTTGHDARESYPTRLRFDLDDPGQASALVVDDTTRLLEAAVSDLQSFGSRLQQSILRRMTGDPQTFKLSSRLRVQPAGLDLRAAHEWVLWGRGAHRGVRRAQPSPSSFL